MHLTHSIRRTGAVIATTALAAGLIGLAAPAAHAEAVAAAAADGTLFLIGGGIYPGEETSDALLTAAIDKAKPHAAAAGRTTPVVAIVSAGSPAAPNAEEAADGDEYDNAAANGLYYQAWFESLGADTLLVPIDENPSEDYPGDHYSSDNAGDQALADAIAAGADAVYLGGGDQTRYVRALMDCAPAANDAFTSCADTPVLASLRAVVDGGGVVAGSSAGLAIQQGEGMITGGEPYESWRDGTTPGSFDNDNLSHIPAGGFDFFTEGIIDSHFARRDRQPRVVRLALDLGRPVAYGVEEYTALVVDRATRTGTVLGDNGVSVLDVSGASFDGTTASGVDYSYLTPGSTLDFATGGHVLAGNPTTAPGTGDVPALHGDIWGSYECDYDINGSINLAKGLVASTGNRATGDTCDTPLEQPRFRTTFNRTASTFWNVNGGFAGLDYTISLIPSFTVTATVDGKPFANGTAQAAGEDPELELTITNTGALSLANLELDLEAAPSAGAAAAAPAAESTPDALAPGESVTVSLPLPNERVTLDGTVTAVALNSTALPLPVDVSAQSITGTVLPAATTTTPEPKPEVKPTVDKQGPERLANTGGDVTLPLLAGAALVAAAALLLSRRRSA